MLFSPSSRTFFPEGSLERERVDTSLSMQDLAQREDNAQQGGPASSRPGPAHPHLPGRGGGGGERHGGRAASRAGAAAAKGRRPPSRLSSLRGTEGRAGGLASPPPSAPPQQGKQPPRGRQRSRRGRLPGRGAGRAVTRGSAHRPHRRRPAAPRCCWSRL